MIISCLKSSLLKYSSSLTTIASVPNQATTAAPTPQIIAAGPQAATPEVAAIPEAAAFVAIWFFSITDKSARAKEEIESFEAQNVRANTGIGADGAVAH